MIFFLLIDGSLFSASIVEPNALEDGTVNVQFTSNYIALLCPIKEISIKRWRLEHIASFGQCGGMLTFECCPRCSDPNYSRCSLNIKQEKPSTILTLMEKAIRENPNTSEIHYERSILGDIYHCSHQCSTSPRLLPALSDSNLYRINSTSSPYSDRKKPEDLKVSIPSSNLRRHGSDVDLTIIVHSNTLESNDSGLPGTPQLEDSPRSSAFISSPTCTNGKPSSPTKKSVKISSPSHRSRCNSDTANRYTQLPFRESVTPGRETDDNESGFVTPSMLLHQHSEPRQNGSLPSSIPRSGSPSKTVTPVARSWTPSVYNKLETVTESNNLSPPPPPTRRESRFRPVSKSPPNILPKHSSPIKSAHIPNGAPPPPPKLITRVKSESKTTSDTSDHESRLEQVRDSSMDRDHPIADLSLPEVPSRHRSGTHILHRELPPTLPRERAQSQSDVLEVSRPSPSKFRGISKSTSDELDDDEEEEMCYEYDTLSELKEINPFFRLEDLEYDETDGEGAHEVMSNLADYRRHKNGYCEPAVIDKVLNKVASENVRGYAYKISIPVAGNVVYDVPRRSAPMADPKHINPNAPPKPLRRVNKNGHIIEQKSPLSQGNLHSREVSIEA